MYIFGIIVNRKQFVSNYAYRINNIRTVLKNMNKIFPCRYRTTGSQTKRTSIIDHLAHRSVSCRNSGPDSERIIIEFKTEGSKSVLEIPATVQYAQIVRCRYRTVN